LRVDFVGIALGLLGAYLAAGLLFAVPFVMAGVQRIDPRAAHGSWGFRVLIIPGTILLWPLLARCWLMGVHEPPEENNSHRRAVRNSSSSRREEAHSSFLTSPRPSPLPPGAEREKKVSP
jgi:hypothetical protein